VTLTLSRPPRCPPTRQTAPPTAPVAGHRLLPSARATASASTRTAASGLPPSQPPRREVPTDAPPLFGPPDHRRRGQPNSSKDSPLLTPKLDHPRHQFTPGQFPVSPRRRLAGIDRAPLPSAVGRSSSASGSGLPDQAEPAHMLGRARSRSRLSPSAQCTFSISFQILLN
jgi:hypothetical protein